MKSIYFESIPQDPQTDKGRDLGSPTIVGATVFGAEFFKALLRHGTMDTIYLPEPTGPAPEVLRDLFASNPGRLRFLAEHQFSELSDAERLTMVTPGSSFLNLLRIRKLCGRPRTPITAVIHSVHYATQLQRVLGLVLSTLQPFDALVCSSNAGHRVMANFFCTVKERLHESGIGVMAPAVKLPVVPLGVDVASFADGDGEPLRSKLSIQDEPVILYFGRFSPTSKADLYPLLTAFADLVQDQPAILVLAGDDTHYGMARQLREFAAELGCGERVRVVPDPSADDKNRLYALADIYTSPSDSLQETFGIAVVEAMAAGLPVVVSDWNGYKDLVVSGETGYLIPTFMPRYPDLFDSLRGSGAMKSPDLLAATTVVDLERLRSALERLIRDADLRRRLGEAGRKRAARLYDWSAVMKQYEILWEELTAEADSLPPDSLSGRLDLMHWGYQEIFAHYPTSFMSSENHVRITKRGRQWLYRPPLLEKISQPSSWFQPLELLRILQLLDPAEEVSIQEALDLSNAGMDKQISQLSHLWRLAKYGLVDVTG